MEVVKYGALGLVVLSGLVILGLVAYSYLLSEPSYRVPQLSEVSASGLIARTSRGTFLDKGAEVLPEVEAPKLGFLAPDFELLTFEGRIVRLSGLRGRPVLLNFWATWCPPCRAEMPDLERFHREYGEKIVLLGVNWNDDPKEARSFLEAYGITYLNAIDRDGKVFVRYRLTAIPTSFWIDERGIIRGIWDGAMSFETLVEGFRKTTHALEGGGP